MQPPSQNTANHKTAADAAESTTNPQQTQTEKIEALLESVNSASQHVRNYYITFLLAGFYIAMIVWSTTDLMLLKDTPVKMPLLDVELPITGFYTFAPYFFLLLHFNLLLQFSLLADKAHRFDRAVLELQDADSRRYYYTRLFAFAFTQALSGRHHSRLLRFLLTLMVWISVIWLPLSILIGLQVGFLAYHSEEILSWQRVAIMLDLLVLFIFWPIIRSPDGNGLNWIIRASGIPFIYLWIISRLPIALPTESKIITVLTQNNPTKNSGNPLFEGGLSLVTLIGVATFSWAIAVLPDSKQEKWVAQHIPDNWKTECQLSSANKNGKRYFWLTEFLFDGRKSVIPKEENGKDRECEITTTRNIFNRNLIIREQLLIANELKAEDEADLTSEDKTIRQAALKKITGLILSDRDLRYADFSGARLPKADFVGTDGKSSDLRYANFSDAMLVDALMKHTKFQGAILLGAQLQGANLGNADLQGAYLSTANLQGADLSNADLQEATLLAADLQGANLDNADLQGANLNYADLQGADLRSAELPRTNLGNADLQGADLSNADLQGANLRGAQLLGAVLSMTDLSYSDISDVVLGSLTPALEALQATISQATGKDVWHNDSSRLSKYGFSDTLEVAKDKSDYQNKLAAYLIDLSCKDPWTAAGIVRNRIKYSFSRRPTLLAKSLAQCLLSLKDQKNKVGQLVCPAMSKIDKETVAILELAAARDNPDLSIQSTFSCQTKLSDQKQSSE